MRGPRRFRAHRGRVAEQVGFLALQAQQRFFRLRVNPEVRAFWSAQRSSRWQSTRGGCTAPVHVPLARVAVVLVAFHGVADVLVAWSITCSIFQFRSSTCLSVVA